MMIWAGRDKRTHVSRRGRSRPTFRTYAVAMPSLLPMSIPGKKGSSVACGSHQSPRIAARGWRSVAYQFSPFRRRANRSAILGRAVMRVPADGTRPRNGVSLAGTALASLHANTRTPVLRPFRLAARSLRCFVRPAMLRNVRKVRKVLSAWALELVQLP
jgi:hypothetical protein